MIDEHTQNEQKLLTKRIVVYLLITFTLTYLIEIGGMYPLYRQIVDHDNQEVMPTFSSLLSLSLFLPGICAALTRLITREGFKGTNLYLDFNIKDKGRYYIFSWFGTIGLILVGMIVYYVVFPAYFDLGMGRLSAAYESAGQTISGQVILIELIMAAFFAPVFSILTCFGEEWGFRGYLLPMLIKKFKTIPAIFICGLIWGIWNAPLVAMGYNYGEEYQGYPFTGIIAMCIFCIVMGIFYSYLCIKTGSCIPAILAHCVINGFSGVSNFFLAADAEVNSFIGPMPTGLMGGIGFIIAAVFILAQFTLEKKSEKRM